MNNLQQQNFSGTLSTLSNRWEGFYSDERFDGNYFHAKDKLYAKSLFNKVCEEKLISERSIKRIQNIFAREINNKRPEENTFSQIEKILDEIGRTISPELGVSLKYYQVQRNITWLKIYSANIKNNLPSPGLVIICLIGSIYALVHSYKLSNQLHDLSAQLKFLEDSLGNR